MTASAAPVPHLPRASSLALLRVFFGDRLEMLERFAEGAGDIGRFRLGTRTLVLVNTPDLLHEILVEKAADFQKGPALRVYARPVLGSGLLTSEGAFHQRQRRLAAPAFTPRRVSGYARVMAEAAENAQRGWRDGETVDVAHEMMRLTLGIVGETVFDADVLGEADELGRALTVAMRFTVEQIRSPFRLPFAWIPPWKTDVRGALARLDATIYRLIAERRATAAERTDLLSLLLLAQDEDGARMTDRQLRDEAMTVFLAGHETTANALAWTWYLLARHPEIYAAVRREADDALAGRTPACEDLPRLPYTLQVFKEAMRLYPPAYAVVRQALRAVVLGGYQIPPGAIVVICPYTLHRRPDHFPDPERFDPARFTPEAEGLRHRFAYLPFGGGPRVCLGSHFALMEGHLLLATLAQRVEFHRTAEAPVVPEALITLRPRGGVPLRVRRRPGGF